MLQERPLITLPSAMIGPEECAMRLSPTLVSHTSSPVFASRRMMNASIVATNRPSCQIAMLRVIRPRPWPKRRSGSAPSGSR